MDKKKLRADAECVKNIDIVSVNKSTQYEYETEDVFIRTNDH